MNSFKDILQLNLARFEQLLKLNLTRVILIICFLILGDQIIVFNEKKDLQEPAQIRLLTQEVDSIRALRHLIDTSDGFKIVYIGDSIVYGSGVRARQTIPFYLEEELRKKYPKKDIKIFNYAYKGYGISEDYFMANSLRNADVDLVIFGVSSGWFNRKAVIDHQNTVKITSDIFQENKVRQLGVPLKVDKVDRIEEAVSDVLTSHWAMYRNRSNLAARILGKPLADKLFSYKAYIYNRETYEKQIAYQKDVETPWYEKNMDKEMKNYTRVGWVNLSENNSQVGFYKLLQQLLGEMNTPSLFYVTPLNVEFLNHYGKFDQNTWNKSRAKLDKLTDPNIVQFVDMTTSVPGKFFSDSVHMLAPGNELLARKLAAEIDKRGSIE